MDLTNRKKFLKLVLFSVVGNVQQLEFSYIAVRNIIGTPTLENQSYILNLNVCMYIFTLRSVS